MAFLIVRRGILRVRMVPFVLKIGVVRDIGRFEGRIIRSLDSLAGENFALGKDGCLNRDVDRV